MASIYILATFIYFMEQTWLQYTHFMGKTYSAFQPVQALNAT